MPTVLVTGSTGFIGANLVRHLLARGDRVKCIIRKPNMVLEGLELDLHTLPLGAEDQQVEDLARVLDDVEEVYHVAGIFDPSPGGAERMHAVHVSATEGLLRASDKAGVRRLLLCSSSVTVGFGPLSAPGDEDTVLDAGAIYGEGTALRAYHDSKLAAETLAAGWAGTETVTVNPDFIIGAWDVKPTSGQMILTMAQRRLVPVYPRGGKCFMDADDCAIGHIRAMERGQPGTRYLLGAHNLSYRAFMELTADVVGAFRPRIPLPNTLMRLAGRVGGRLQRMDPHRFAGLDPKVLSSMQQERYRSGARARDELGVPQTDMRVAIEKCHRWFRDHGRL